jgi:hypothetical protein
VRPNLVLATVAALTIGLLGTAPASAEPPPTEDRAKPPKVFAITLGQVGTGACNVGSPAAVVIDTAGAGTPTYIAPADGVLTWFSHRANGVAGQVRAIVFADGPTATQKTVVAKSAKLTVAANTVNTFGIQLPIKAGQRLGLGYTANNMACATAAGHAGDTTLVKAPFDPDTSSAFVAAGVLSGGPGITFRPNISAVLESDVDGDGWGDVTQDGCPQSAQVLAPCPDTTVTKKPKHKTTRKKVRVRIKFVASIPGSTFQCRLDGHSKWKPCESPYKKRLGVGKHKLEIRAVSPTGVPDPKPAKAKFRIRRA